jgi:hypothetical protein
MLKNLAGLLTGLLAILVVAICLLHFSHSLMTTTDAPLHIAMVVAVLADRRAYTVREFCEVHRISRSALYCLWREGIGPRFISIGIKKLISVEAAEAWRREREEAALTADEAAGSLNLPTTETKGV